MPALLSSEVWRTSKSMRSKHVSARTVESGADSTCVPVGRSWRLYFALGLENLITHIAMDHMWHAIEVTMNHRMYCLRLVFVQPAQIQTFTRLRVYFSRSSSQELWVIARRGVASGAVVHKFLLCFAQSEVVPFPGISREIGDFSCHGVYLLITAAVRRYVGILNLSIGRAVCTTVLRALWSMTLEGVLDLANISLTRISNCVPGSSKSSWAGWKCSLPLRKWLSSPCKAL